MSLPTSKTFLTALFTSLSDFQPGIENANQTQDTPGRLNPSLPPNPLLTNPDQTKALKPLLTTIHLLFPNEFLLALDLIDRCLVTKLSPASERNSGSAGPPPPTSGIYIVRSSSSGTAPSSTRRAGSVAVDPDGTYPRWQAHAQANVYRSISYEIRLRAWSCSCPAFTFDVVNQFGVGEGAWEADVPAPGEDLAGSEGEEVSDGDVGMGWVYGGLRRERNEHADGESRKQIPVCKHLLACLLVEHCPMLREGVEEREVSREELAGWAAGWGD